MRIQMLFSVLGLFCFSSISFAQTAMQATVKKVKVASVLLQLQSGPKPRYLDGRLYRMEDGLKRKHIADIDSQGKVIPDVECVSGEKLDADVRVELIMKEDGPFFCGEKLTFRFKSYVYTSAPGANDIAAARQHLSDSNWADASLKLTNAAASLRNAGEIERAVAVENAAVGAFAKALGDSNLDQLVVRDVSQNRRLVFSEQGKAEIKKFQIDKSISQTGNLDFRTAGAMARQ